MLLISLANKKENIKASQYMGSLVQDCGISSANALEILQSCTEPSICTFKFSNWWLLCTEPICTAKLPNWWLLCTEQQSRGKYSHRVSSSWIHWWQCWFLGPPSFIWKCYQFWKWPATVVSHIIDHLNQVGCTIIDLPGGFEWGCWWQPVIYCNNSDGKINFE